MLLGTNKTRLVTDKLQTHPVRIGGGIPKMKNPRRKRTGYLSAKTKYSSLFPVTPQSGGVLDPVWNKKSASCEADFRFYDFSNRCSVKSFSSFKISFVFPSTTM